MFIRKKKNPSGVVSVQIIDKSTGKYRVLKTIGSSSEEKQIEQPYLEGKKWIAFQTGTRDIFEEQKKNKVNLPMSGNSITKTMLLTPNHKSIEKLDEDFWKNI